MRKGWARGRAATGGCPYARVGSHKPRIASTGKAVVCRAGPGVV